MSPSRSVLVAGALAASVQGQAAIGSEGGAPGLFLVPMNELVVPIVEGGQASGRLRVRLVMRAADAAAATRLQAGLPQLREASFAVTAEFARLYASPWMPVDARRLAGQIDAALRARDPGIASVLVVQVSAVRA